MVVFENITTDPHELPNDGQLGMRILLLFVAVVGVVVAFIHAHGVFACYGYYVYRTIFHFIFSGFGYVPKTILIKVSCTSW
jgi:hypothetical protein